jgi:hypothetical protein
MLAAQLWFWLLLGLCPPQLVDEGEEGEKQASASIGMCSLNITAAELDPEAGGSGPDRATTASSA